MVQRQLLPWLASVGLVAIHLCFGQPVAPLRPPVRIYCGEAHYRDTGGRNWIHREYVTGAGFGAIVGANITGSTSRLMPIYQSECFGREMVVNVPLANGRYSVTMYNTESYFSTARARVFNVIAEGVMVISNWDIFRESRGKFRAQYKRFSVAVADGALTITFSVVDNLDNPRFSGIEIQAASGGPVSSPSPTPVVSPSPTPVVSPSPSPVVVPSPSPVVSPSPTPLPVPSPSPVVPGNPPADAPTRRGSDAWFLNLNMGPAAVPFTDPYDGSAWVVGNQYLYNCENVPTCVANSCTADDGNPNNFATYPENYQNLYAFGCMGNRGIYIDVPVVGTYRVTYIGAETWHQVANARLFNVLVEGTVMMERVDQFNRSGGTNRPWNETFLVPVLDNRINITTQTIQDNAVIKGLQIALVDSQPNWLRANRWPMDMSGQIPGLTENDIYSKGDDEIRFATHELTLTALYNLAIATARFEVQGTNWPTGSAVLKATLFTPGATAYINVTNSNDVRRSTGEAAIPQTTWVMTRGQSVRLSILFRPDKEELYNATFVITSTDGVVVMRLPLWGTGDRQARAAHSLHVVYNLPQAINTDNVIINADGTGTQAVDLDGSVSHTHERNMYITGWQWRRAAGAVLSDSTKITTMLPVGNSDLSLTITDNSGRPPAQSSLTEAFTVRVVPPTAVPGCFVRYYTGANPSIDGTPSNAQILPDAILRQLPEGLNNVGNVLVRFTCYSTVIAGALAFTQTGGFNGRLQLPAGGVDLPTTYTAPAGRFNLEWTFMVNSGPGQLPVTLLVNGLDNEAGNVVQLHDQTTIPPFITFMSPIEGSEQGNQTITIQALAFNPADATVLIGATELPMSAITYKDPAKLIFIIPPGNPGKVSVSLRSKNLVSNRIDYEYLSKDVPNIKFTRRDYTIRSGVLAMAMCHNRMYMNLYNYTLLEVAFTEDYEMQVLRRFNALVDINYPDMWGKVVLGMACDPWEPANSNWKLWFSSGPQGDPDGRINPFHPRFDNARGSLYGGYIWNLQAPNFDRINIVVRNLPIAVDYHGTGGTEFDNNRDLMQLVGHMSNAGSPERTYAYLGDSYFNSAMLKMPIWRDDFDGNIQYEFRPRAPQTCAKLEYDNREYGNAGQPGVILSEFPYDTPGRSTTTRHYGIQGPDGVARSPMDLRVGHYVQPSNTTGRVYIRVAASGYRNALGICQTLGGDIYVVDNGPNTDSGWSMNGPPTASNDDTLSCQWSRSQKFAGGPDKLFLFHEDAYHGTPNMNRAVDDPRLWYWHHPEDRVPTGYPANPSKATPFTPAIWNPPSSSNGIDEYRANTFRGKMKGWLWICQTNSHLHLVQLKTPSEVQRVTRDDGFGENFPANSNCLYVKCIPGGACVTGEVGANNEVKILIPDDSEASQPTRPVLVYDVYPNRAPSNIIQGAIYPFTIGGANFDQLSGNIRVRFGQAIGTITSRTSKRIYGYIPAAVGGFVGLVDVTVEDVGNLRNYQLAMAFRYLKPEGPPPALTNPISLTGSNGGATA